MSMHGKVNAGKCITAAGQDTVISLQKTSSERIAMTSLCLAMEKQADVWCAKSESDARSLSPLQMNG